MSDSLCWAGVDTSTRTYAVCVTGDGGKILSEAELSADAEAVHAFLSGQPRIPVQVALETGTTSVHLARALTEMGYPVSVYDAFKVHRFLQTHPNKTDNSDARGLAEIARIGCERLKKVYIRPLRLAVPRSKLVIRERLMKMRKLNEAAMMSLFHAYGVRADERVSSSTSLRRVLPKMIKAVERNYDIPIRQLVTPLLRLSLTLRKEELRLENELKAFAAQDETCRRLMEIPGVGVITAVSFVTAVGDPFRFKRTEDVAAYFGLTPRVWRTGSYVRRRGISKFGSGMTRRHLHCAARQALDARKEGTLQLWGRALAARSNRRLAIVAVARKLAVVMLAIWKNGSKYDPAGGLTQTENCC